MEILLYDRLNTAPVQRQFDKTLAYLQQGDFRSADVRKMKTQGYYRARLDDTNRLLFKIGEYQEKKYLFLLEVILNHDYDKSRFLRGTTVQEEKLKPIASPDAIPEEEVMDIKYLNPKSRSFTILDRCITFDENQAEILLHEPPMLLLGAAGCGKTMLALEKIRQVQGRILYVTLSSGLAQKAQDIYHVHSEPIEGQEVSFLSLDQYLRLFLVPSSHREVNFQDFKTWFERIRSTVRIKDCHKLFEEIRGVLTGAFTNIGFCSPDEYNALGVRQSIFPLADRAEVYAIFIRYTNWLKSEELYDPNIFAKLAHDHIQPTFDMVAVDEVQDMTTMQLSAVLKSLKQPHQFILSGDANQVVHPNFFSWTSVKRFLHQRNLSKDIIRLLPGNFRNDEKIVKLANKVLALKNARFGSIDKESSTVIDPGELMEGETEAVQFFEHNETILKHLDQAASISSQIAVLVLREADKAAARQHFHTPMIFTVHEAKGLEFNFVILYNFISSSSEQFAAICKGVAPRDLNGALQYSRPKDKEDRSLQAYQFYINSLYVAITRAKHFLFVIEREPRHRLLSLLGVRNLKKRINKHTPMPASTLADWQRAADELEKFGRKEQAEAIRAKVGNAVPVPWEPITFQEYNDIRHKYIITLDAVDKRPSFSTKEQTRFYNHLLFYPDNLGMLMLFSMGKNRLKQHLFEKPGYLKKILMPYQADNIHRIEPVIKKYGPNHVNDIGLTPLMLASMAGAANIAKYLLMAGANPSARDNWGRNAYQLAIVRGFKDERFAKEKLALMAGLVHPPHLEFKNMGDLVSLPHGNLPYMVTAIIHAIQRELFFLRKGEAHVGVQVSDICKLLPYLVPDEQQAKKYTKEYIHAFLMKSDVKLNKNPFIIPLRKGYFTLMLSIEVKICDEWVELLELFDASILMFFQNDTGLKAFQEDILAWAAGMNTHFERKVEKEIMDEDEAYAASLPDSDLRDWPA